MELFNIKKSVSKKISYFVAVSIIIILGLTLVFVLNYSQNEKLDTTKEIAQELSASLKESLIFAMDEGITDVEPLIERMKVIQNIAELRVIPTEIIDETKAKELDPVERNVAAKNEDFFSDEDFQNIHVFRTVSSIVATESCLNCHDGNVGDALAVISLRYSTEKTYEAIAGERAGAIIMVIILALIVWLIIHYLIKYAILKDLFGSISSITKLSKGDVSENIIVNREDEFGQLSESLKRLKEGLEKQSNTVREFANGNIDVEVDLLSEQDILGKSVIEIKRSITLLSKDARTLSIAAFEGDLSEKVDVEKHNGVFKNIITGFNSAFDYLTAPIKEGAKVIEKFSEGILTARVTGEYKGEHQLLKNSINNLGNSFSSLIDQVKEAVSATASAANQISSSSEEMAAGAHEQTQQATEVAGAVEEMTKTILESTKNAGLAADTSKQQKLMAEEGKGKVEQTKKGMERIVSSAKETGAKINSLATKTEQIGDIAQVIDDIADQTNLLALNAAIEAARAGEQGRGFAVVADEVRKLAERTTKATKEIAETIKAVQKEAKDADQSMVEAGKAVEEGNRLTEEVSESLQDILIGADRVSDIVGQVAAASEEQSAASEQISKNIEGISSVTQQSAAGTQQIAKAAEDLNRLTLNLQELISRFKIDTSDRQRGFAVRQNGKLIES